MKKSIVYIFLFAALAFLIILLSPYLPFHQNENTGRGNADSPEILENNRNQYESQEDALEDNPQEELSDIDTQLFFEVPEQVPEKTFIRIYKSQRLLELFADEKLIGRFKIALGRSPEGHKTKEGDSKTPEGKYYICTRNANSSFHKFLGLSYPNTEDARNGLQQGLINSSTFQSIRASQEHRQQPPWNTPLGGAVGIHGGGYESDWTLGCIALTNQDIDILWKYAPLKTGVEIFE